MKKTILILLILTIGITGIQAQETRHRIYWGRVLSTTTWESIFYVFDDFVITHGTDTPFSVRVSTSGNYFWCALPFYVGPTTSTWNFYIDTHGYIQSNSSMSVYGLVVSSSMIVGVLSVLNNIYCGNDLFVGDDIHISEYIYHLGDEDTFMHFTLDQVVYWAGGLEYLNADEGGTDEIDFGNAAWDFLYIGNRSGAETVYDYSDESWQFQRVRIAINLDMQGSDINDADDIFCNKLGFDRLGQDAFFRWSSSGNDHLVLGLKFGNASYSGNWLIVNEAYNGNDYGHAVVDDPHFIIHSSTGAAVSTDQFIEFWHDKTNANVNIGTGSLVLQFGGVAKATMTVDGDLHLDGGLNLQGDCTAQYYYGGGNYLTEISSLSVGAVTTGTILDGTINRVDVDASIISTSSTTFIRGDILYYDGANWVLLSTAGASAGEVLEISPSGIPEWDADDSVSITSYDPARFTVPGTIGVGDDQTPWWSPVSTCTITDAWGVLKSSGTTGITRVDVWISEDFGVTKHTIFTSSYTVVEFDLHERSSLTATNPPVIDTNYDNLMPHWIMGIDVDKSGGGQTVSIFVRCEVD